MPKIRKISIEDFNRLMQEKHYKVEEIKEILNRSFARNERNRELKLAPKLNEIIETEPTQEGRDFLLALIMLYRMPRKEYGRNHYSSGDGHPHEGYM